MDFTRKEIEALLVELEAIDDGSDCTQDFWTHLRLYQDSFMKIELLDDGFRVTVGLGDVATFEIYSSKGNCNCGCVYYRSRWRPAFIKDDAIENQQKAGEIYDRVISKLLGIAA